MYIYSTYYVYEGGSTYNEEDGYTYYDEIFTYNSALDSWSITGRMEQPRAAHVVALLCPRDWDGFQDTCYRYEKEKKTWEAARQHCIDLQV